MFVWRSIRHVKSALLLALLFALLLAVPVSAGGPEIYDGVSDEDYLLFVDLCPGIEVWDHEVIAFRQWFYLDEEGNIKRIKIHFNGTDNFYSPQNPGVVLSGSFSGNTEVDLETWDYINVHGVPVRITIPGYGTALVRAGFWPRYPDDHKAGKDSFEDPDDIAAFCAYLAGD